MLRAIRTRFARIDERPVEQIDREIDDELASHLALLETDLIESGLSPSAARETALFRFGNPAKHKRHCRDVALQERRMKTVVQFVIPTLCCLVLAAVTTSIWFNQRSASAALSSMSERMDRLSQSLDARAAASAPVNGGVVYIKGAPVERPGVYNMPAGGATLRRMLTAAGVNDQTVGRIEIRADRFESSGGLWTMNGEAFRSSAGKDVDVQDKDLIVVIEAKP